MTLFVFKCPVCGWTTISKDSYLEVDAKSKKHFEEFPSHKQEASK